MPSHYDFTLQILNLLVEHISNNIFSCITITSATALPTF